MASLNVIYIISVYSSCSFPNKAAQTPFRSSSLHCLTAAFPSWSLALCWILFPHSSISHSDAKQLLQQAGTRYPLTMSLLVPLPVLLIPIRGSASSSALAHICKRKWGTSTRLNIADKYQWRVFARICARLSLDTAAWTSAWELPSSTNLRGYLTESRNPALGDLLGLLWRPDWNNPLNP